MMFNRPVELYFLCLWLAFLAVGALYGGGALILQPDGSLLQMQPWLDKIPFPDFLIPGTILFVFNGLLPPLAITGLWLKPDWKICKMFNIYRDKHWGWTFSLYSGIITVTWIIAQQFLTEYFILQPIVALVGLLIIVFTLMPRVMQCYTT